MKKKNKKTLGPRLQYETIVTGSRGAVETVIDVAKDDKSSTWEQSLRHTKIARWDELAKNSSSSL